MHKPQASTLCYPLLRRPSVLHKHVNPSNVCYTRRYVLALGQEIGYKTFIAHLDGITCFNVRTRM